MIRTIPLSPCFGGRLGAQLRAGVGLAPLPQQEIQLMARPTRYDPDSDRVREVMRKDAARIQELWAAAKAKYEEADGGSAAGDTLER